MCAALFAFLGRLHHLPLLFLVLSGVEGEIVQLLAASKDGHRRPTTTLEVASSSFWGLTAGEQQAGAAGTLGGAATTELAGGANFLGKESRKLATSTDFVDDAEEQATGPMVMHLGHLLLLLFVLLGSVGGCAVFLCWQLRRKPKAEKGSGEPGEEESEPGGQVFVFVSAVVATFCFTLGVVLFEADAGKAACLMKEGWDWSRGRWQWSEWDWACLTGRPLIAIALILWVVGSFAGCFVCGSCGAVCAGLCKEPSLQTSSEGRAAEKKKLAPVSTEKKKSAVKVSAEKKNLARV